MPQVPVVAPIIMPGPGSQDSKLLSKLLSKLISNVSQGVHSAKCHSLPRCRDAEMCVTRRACTEAEGEALEPGPGARCVHLGVLIVQITFFKKSLKIIQYIQFNSFKFKHTYLFQA